MLWSRPGMTRAGVILDMKANGAWILCSWVNLNLTNVGHYALDILPPDDEETMTIEECLLTLPEDPQEKMTTLIKLHRQFGHPREEVMKGLLKKVNCNDIKTSRMVTEIHETCRTCKRFSQMPPKPVVSLPATRDFGEILTMDLKEVKVGP